MALFLLEHADAFPVLTRGLLLPVQSVDRTLDTARPRDEPCRH